MRLGWLAVLLLGALAACQAPGLNQPSPEVGARAPDFALPTLQGETLRLSDLRGQVVLVNFWATWCGPCRVEMPTMQARYNHDGFTIVAVNFAEEADVVQAYADELQLSFPIVLDGDGAVQELYRVRGYPSSFFVDPDGIVRFFHIGEMSESVMDTYLAEMGVAP